MPDLLQSLQGRDLGHLKIIAELWEINLTAPDTRIAYQRLIPALLDPQKVRQVALALPAEASKALDDLVQNEGRLPWAQFTRRYGAVREMGPGRRDRDRPYLKPVSAAEMLWYRALVARAFFDTPNAPVEYAYIPEDLLSLLPIQAGRLAEAQLGRPATPAERLHPLPASDRLLDHATSLLAALRLGIEYSLPPWAANPPQTPLTPGTLRQLLHAAGLLDRATGVPLPEPTRLFLESPRAAALALLAQAWIASPEINDLRLVPYLQAEGEWTNDPHLARQAILSFLATLPPNTWWSLSAFTAAVRHKHPDFQRPAGDYDSWFLRDTRLPEEDNFLRGFEHWDDVEGGLIRYLLTGPLHWLGMTDLAAPSDQQAPEPPPATAFRLSAWASALLAGQPPAGLADEDAAITIRSDARLQIPRLAPRVARYQLSRFSLWESERADLYNYRLSPASLERARSQGLTVGHLTNLLRRYASPVPPSLLKALDRWDQRGSEVRFQRLVVLRLSSPELLQALRASRAGRFLGDPLGPTTIAVKEGAVTKVMEALAEMGYLGEVDVD